jgi:hypothetical protein
MILFLKGRESLPPGVNNDERARSLAILKGSPLAERVQLSAILLLRLSPW